MLNLFYKPNICFFLELGLNGEFFVWISIVLICLVLILLFLFIPPLYGKNIVFNILKHLQHIYVLIICLKLKTNIQTTCFTSIICHISVQNQIF